MVKIQSKACGVKLDPQCAIAIRRIKSVNTQCYLHKYEVGEYIPLCVNNKWQFYSVINPLLTFNDSKWTPLLPTVRTSK